MSIEWVNLIFNNTSINVNNINHMRDRASVFITTCYIYDYCTDSGSIWTTYHISEQSDTREHTDVRKGVLDAAGGPSTMLVFKQRTHVTDYLFANKYS